MGPAKSNKLRFCTLLVLFAFFVPAGLYALSAPNVSIDQREYKDIDKLISAGLVGPTIVGQRPYSRSEFARMISEAIRNENKIKNMNPVKQKYLKRILQRLTQEYHFELVSIGAVKGEAKNIVVHPLKTLSIDPIYISEDMESFPPNNGVSQIDARLFPFGAYQEGRPIVDGFQTLVESEHSANLSKYFSLYAHPLFRLAEESKAYIHKLYGKFEIANFELEAGRDSIVWGLGEYGPFMISDNARALDMVKITNPSPTKLPYFLKHIGDIRYTIFVSNLGPEQYHKYPYFTGYKVSILPFGLWELGFSHTVMLGGEGVPGLSFLNYVSEFIGIRSDIYGPTSNHLMEFETAVTVPALNYSRFYVSINFDDVRDTLKRVFKDGAAYMGGIYVPGLLEAGNADVRIEYYHTPPIQYGHGVYQNGYTLNRNIIGSNLGTDGDAIHAEYHQDIHENEKLDFTASFDWERRNSNIYAVTTDPDGTIGAIYKVQSKPAEQRFRFGLKHRMPVGKDITLESYAGYERIHKKDFIQGNAGNGFAAAVKFKYDFDRFFQYAR